MKVMTRVLIIDPDDGTRLDLQRALGGFGSAWVSELVPSYEQAEKAGHDGADIALVVLDSDREKALQLIRQLQANPSRWAVIACSASRDADTILQAIRAGAQEFVRLPADLEDLRQAIERLSPRAETSIEGARVITVTGACGGVGCSTIAVNLAVALAHRPDCSVALADFDMLLGIADASLDIVPEQTVADVARQTKRLDPTLLKRSMTAHSSGLFVLPCPARMEEAASIDPESIRRIIELMRKSFSMVIVEIGKGFSATDFVALESSDSILLVTELELACLRNTAKLLQLIRQCGDMADKVRVVVNRAGSATSAISPKRAEQTLGLPLTWQVPNASNVISACRSKGVPLETVAPGCRTHRALQDIAQSLAGGPKESPKTSSPRLGRLASLFS